MKRPRVGEKIKLPGFGTAKIISVHEDGHFVAMKRGRRIVACSYEALEGFRLQTWRSDGKEAIRADGWSREGYRGREVPQWKRVWVKSPWRVIGPTPVVQ